MVLKVLSWVLVFLYFLGNPLLVYEVIVSLLLKAILFCLFSVTLPLSANLYGFKCIYNYEENWSPFFKKLTCVLTEIISYLLSQETFHSPAESLWAPTRQDVSPCLFLSPVGHRACLMTCVALVISVWHFTGVGPDSEYLFWVVIWKLQSEFICCGIVGFMSGYLCSKALTWGIGLL